MSDEQQLMRRGDPLDPAGPGGGAEYAELLAAFRVLQNQFAGAAMPPAVEAEIAAELAGINARMAAYVRPEASRIDGRRPDLPGRGSPLLPEMWLEETEAGIVRGSVTFGRFYLGVNGAAHGGTPPLVFDDVLGRAASMGPNGLVRTAFLKLDYRKITPVGVPLRIEAGLDEVDGRKRWVSGQLLDQQGTVLVDASALFLELLPGQP
jgi:hypothetical protein